MSKPPSFNVRAVLGWCLFDGANTIFSYVVVTRYLNDWIINTQHQPDWTIGLMGFFASLCLLFLLPVLGAVADTWGRHKPILIAATLVSVSATALLGVVSSAVAALVIAAVGIVGFQIALSQYDPLLVKVAPPERRGRVSGYGVAVGYLGVLVAIPVMGMLVHDNPQDAFLPAALMFGLGSVPCFFWVKEGKGNPVGSFRELAASTRVQTVSALKHARTTSFGRLLLARFLYVDAISTVIAFMTVYATRVGGFSDGQINTLLALSILFSVTGAVVVGLLIRRYGPGHTLLWVVGFIIFTLSFGAASGSLGLWLLGPMVGVCLGAVNTADRVYALGLAKPSERGALFGLNTLVGKLSSGVGPLVLWGGTVAVAQELGLSAADASRCAVAVLALSAGVGWLVLRRLVRSDPPLYADSDEEDVPTASDVTDPQPVLPV
jgi:MFS transporter, UMF1 family